VTLDTNQPGRPIDNALSGSSEAARTNDEIRPLGHQSRHARLQRCRTADRVRLRIRCHPGAGGRRCWLQLHVAGRSLRIDDMLGPVLHDVLTMAAAFAPLALCGFLTLCRGNIGLRPSRHREDRSSVTGALALCTNESCKGREDQAYHY